MQEIVQVLSMYNSLFLCYEIAVQMQEAGVYMLKDIKDKIDFLLENNKYSIGEIDYGRLKAYIDLLYYFALPYASEKRTIEDYKEYLKK